MTRYSNYFFTSQKASSTKGQEIQVLKPDMLNAFLCEVANDIEIDTDTKCILALLLSGGARVSEALSVNMKDIEKKNGQIVVKIKVSKVKADTYRDVVIHPAMRAVFEAKMSMKRYNEYLFTERASSFAPKKELARREVDRKLKRYFGDVSAHSFRHANVAFLMSKGLTHIQIASILKMSLRNVENYAHTQATDTMAALFEVA